tara:strand:+ start:241680 stop:242411 length:732 start_codon:yes stop_codon:yes gene_type:complete
MRSFKIRVTDKCKGELTLKATRKALRRNWVSTLTEEELADPDTQIHLRAGRIELLDDEKPIVEGKYFRSTTHRILTLGGLNRIINQNQTFFVNEPDLDDSQLNDYIDKGWFIEVTDEEAAPKPKKSASKKSSKKTAKKTSKKAASKKSNEKSAVSKTKVVKQAASEEEQDEANVQAQADSTPEGMYVHVPDGSDAPAPRRTPKNETILDLDLDGPDDDGLSFVDQEQREERKLPVAKDNAEVE